MLKSHRFSFSGELAATSCFSHDYFSVLFEMTAVPFRMDSAYSCRLLDIRYTLSACAGTSAQHRPAPPRPYLPPLSSPLRAPGVHQHSTAAAAPQRGAEQQVGSLMAALLEFGVANRLPLCGEQPPARVRTLPIHDPHHFRGSKANGIIEPPHIGVSRLQAFELRLY